MAASISLVEARVRDAEDFLTQMPQDQSQRPSPRVLKRLEDAEEALKAQYKRMNDTLEAVADEVDDDIDPIPMEEPKSKTTSTLETSYGPDEKDSETNPESDEPVFKPGAKVLIHNPKTKHWDRSAIVINWRRGYGMSSRMEPKESREGSYGQARDVTTTTNARRKVVFTLCGLKVHSYYSE